MEDTIIDVFMIELRNIIMKHAIEFCFSYSPVTVKTEIKNTNGCYIVHI